VVGHAPGESEHCVWIQLLSRRRNRALRGSSTHQTKRPNVGDGKKRADCLELGDVAALGIREGFVGLYHSSCT
jgi:hypothetical protein